MNDLPPVPPRLIRKSAYGRTQLFLPSKETILREVKCMGGVTRYNRANVYHVLPELMNASNIACWHCCEPIEDTRKPIPIPRIYDHMEGVYHVFGATCCPGCTKAYIIEHTRFDRGQHINVLTRMLQDVYDVTTPVVETPPRPTLLRFGGLFDPRKMQKTECKLVEPPFISYSMLAEERSGDSDEIPMTIMSNVEEADTFDEPQPPSMFEEFLTKQANGSDVLKRRRESSSSGSSSTQPTGPMAKFVKRQSR